ncbi:Copper-exporting ATPase / responsive-to-antagonist 1 / copper-transporting ATPase (RAN1) isoform 1 [Hibiscus syriacus]|uniref:Copper-exporting ATPase / responsive-to-antagonist 1 / copper-transporting ATPase (RAN1) isoform 1 n=1 Tax=Hibiscus syriacus TaxID=106335 RepID=A0A6A2WKQ0_HIBSY|nr:Copper-exporting ATPase / responsive-to-antagonist 1 / copper-transporting ATPase (RAN1) isoform 1 [Hibiscus syriacus]
MSNSGGSSNGWMQFYEQTSADEVSAPYPVFSDATMVTTSSVFSPKGSSSKPIRRRPRVSKRKPTTLLNANASNFRALVQQFTGCPATTLSANRRGPINLNFALRKEHNLSGTATSIMPAAGNHYYYQQSHQENVSQQQQLQQQQSFGDVEHDGLFSSSSSRANADQILEEFELDNISLQAFNRDVPYGYSNEYVNDGNYFL